MRKNSLFILLLVALLSLPTFAFADATTDELSGGKGVGWQGIITSGDDTGLYGVVGRARNKYNMACWVMGKNPLTIADEVRSKLSDPSFGGRFYEYANTFESIPSWEYVPEWQPTYTNLTYVLYGFDFQWESAVPQSLYEGAKEDFRRVLAGEDVGGGDSGGSSIVVGDYYQVDLRAWGNTIYDSSRTITATNATIDSNGVLTVGTGTRIVSSYSASPYYVSTARAFLSHSVVEFVNNLISQGYKVGFSYDGAIFVASDLTVLYGRIPGNSGESLYYYYSPSGSIRFYSSQHSSFYYDGTLFCFANSINGNFSSVGKYGPAQYFCDPISTPFVAPPSGTWPEPETPVTPTAPEIPTPTAPTVEPDPTPTEPTPTWPVIPTPTAPTVVTVVTPEGLDYTQLLTLINDNLNDINSYIVAINSSLNSLRSDLVTEFDGVTQGLRNIYQYLQHLDDLLERHCKHLRDALDDGIYNLELYIKSLFEWLPQQLDFDAKFDYDDTTVTSLLRRILGKIPGGTGDAPTSYMPNPQADELGFFDWLLDLWHRFLIDLVSVLPDELGGLVDAFSQLTHYFPFSIPWDLAALLALFEHEPVTPVFDVPWGFGGEEGEIEMVRVDLSSWDGVMEMVRPVFVVGFCWQLAMITKELLGNFDINKGGV